MDFVIFISFMCVIKSDKLLVLYAFRYLQCRDVLPSFSKLNVREVIKGRIFCDAARDVYGKSEQNDKNVGIMDPIWSLLLLFNFFFQKLTSVLLKNTDKFLDKKNWIKVTMIIWDSSSKHFYRFTHFFHMRHVLRRKICVPQIFF